MSLLGIEQNTSLEILFKGRLRSKRESQGLDAGSADMMIAAITALADAKLATRNVKDFTGTGIDVINPWDMPK